MECISHRNRYAVLHTPPARGVHTLLRGNASASGFRARAKSDEGISARAQTAELRAGIARMSELKLSLVSLAHSRRVPRIPANRPWFHEDEHRSRRARGMTARDVPLRSSPRLVLASLYPLLIVVADINYACLSKTTACRYRNVALNSISPERPFVTIAQSGIK